MSHGHSGHDSCLVRKLVPILHSETETIARGMTDVDVGSGALLGLDWRGEIAMGRGTIAKRQRGVDCVHSQNEFPGAFSDATSHRLPSSARRPRALFLIDASPSPFSLVPYRVTSKSPTTTIKAFFASGLGNLITPILSLFIFGIDFEVLNHSCKQARK